MPTDRGPRTPRGQDFRERHVKTRKAVGPRGEVVYGADVETRGIVLDGENAEFVTEQHAGGAQAACGCLIEGALKPRFHRDGTMVCIQHYYFCAICSNELVPVEAVIVDKRVYCGGCGERAIDEILLTEFRHPGSFDRNLLAHLKLMKRALRSERRRIFWGRLFGSNQLVPR
jgi:DNA-directed RNA polymerase subunit RPC12/RpoP